MLMHPIDNLAVSAQGFRRNANRVRKVCPIFFCHNSKPELNNSTEHVVSFECEPRVPDA
jgi:hypothetical protein